MKKILLYGAGDNCRIFLDFADLSQIEIISIIDANKAGSVLKNYRIENPEVIFGLQYDEIFVTPRYNRDIVAMLVDKYSIETKRIILPEEINQKYIIKRISEKNNVVFLKNASYDSCFTFILKYLGNNSKCLFLKLLWCEKMSFDIQTEIDLARKLFFFVSFDVIDMKKAGYFDYLKSKNPNSDFFLWICDVCDNKEFGIPDMFGAYGGVSGLKKEFKYCYTYNMFDADKYGLMFYPQIYPNVDIRKYESEVIYDVFFIGNAKKRLNIAYDIYEKLSDKGIRCRFIIVNADEKHHKIDGIKYIDNYMSYEDTLLELSKCKCVLEICDEGDRTSVRYAEAVLFGKKLLVNDESVVKLPYYNTQNIHIYKSAEDINIDWFDENLVDYGYEGIFDTEYYLKNVLDVLV